MRDSGLRATFSKLCWSDSDPWWAGASLLLALWKPLIRGAELGQVTVEEDSSDLAASCLSCVLLLCLDGFTPHL